MEQNFKITEKEIEKNEVDNYGVKMAKRAVQALLGLAAIGMSAWLSASAGAPASFGYFIGGGLTVFTVSDMIRMYKKHKKYQESTKEQKLEEKRK